MNEEEKCMKDLQNEGNSAIKCGCLCIPVCYAFNFASSDKDIV